VIKTAARSKEKISSAKEVFYMYCIPIIAKDTEEAVKKIGKAGKFADFLEVRLDLMESFDIRRLIMAAEKPVIITYRSVIEGGKGKDGYEKSAGYLISAVEAGADFIDVELAMPYEIRDNILKSRGKTKVIISTHISAGTPTGAELENIFNRSVEAGADIVKVVTIALEWEDNLRILGLISRAKKEGVRIISFCMGRLGRMSRVFSVLMGGYMTFASLEAGQESADGQIPIDKMKEITGFFSK
jgi:3-dehydroquinate dehydratase type I